MIRWGLLSTARINRRLIPAIRQSERGELVAVASRSAESASAYAREWEIPTAFPTYEAMLASDEIDAVYIGLPNHLHAEWAIRAMELGKHVLCEKPFALSVADVDRMTAVSQATGMVLAEAFMYRHHPQTKLLGEWVQNGRLGEITRIEGSFSFYLSKRDNVRLKPEMGGGCLWDVGVYPISAAQYLMGGLPTSVFGTQWIGPSGVDESFTGQMTYESGATAQFNASFRDPLYTVLRIFGTNGRLEINRPFTRIDPPDAQLIYYDTEEKAHHVPFTDEYLYLGEVEDMHHAILDGATPYLSLTETRNHVRTVLALYESANQGRVVQLSDSH